MSAQIVDAAGADIVLVGDSLAMVALGYDTTLPLTLEDMLICAKAVRRGVKNALLVVDLPFLSYQISIEEAMRTAGRMLKEAGAQAVSTARGWAGAPVCFHRKILSTLTAMAVPTKGVWLPE